MLGARGKALGIVRVAVASSPPLLLPPHHHPHVIFFFFVCRFSALQRTKIRDDQLRFDENHPTDKGALADVVPFDGIGGNPGCPVWQVAYIVIARQLWKHHGESALPALKLHYVGLKELMAWFDRHAGPDGLLVTHCCASTLRVHTICDGRIACAEWRTPTPSPVFVRCPAVLHLLGSSS